MATNGAEIVEQLRGRVRFYHVGDPVRLDMERACEEIEELRRSTVGVTGSSGTAAHTAASVGAWLDAEGIKLLPWQRKRLGLSPARKLDDAASGV